MEFDLHAFNEKSKSYSASKLLQTEVATEGVL